MNRRYFALGLVVLGLLVAAELRGWTPAAVSRAREPIPASVRDNPGAYRAHYIQSGRYVGGK